MAELDRLARGGLGGRRLVFAQVLIRLLMLLLAGDARQAMVALMWKRERRLRHRMGHRGSWAGRG